MLKYTISKVDKDLVGEVVLYPVKSISSKVLIFRVIKHTKTDQKNLVEKEDAEIIFDTIPEIQKTIEKNDVGRALRHLRSFFNYFKGEWLITGSNKAKDRPLEKIVNLLYKEGINIGFIEREGLPPFKMLGKNFRGNTIIKVDGSISTTTISATLVLSPNLNNSVAFVMRDNILGSSYIELTLKALQYLGINSGWDMRDVLIESEFKDGSEINVEADWSAASYWYEAAALSENCNLTIKGLNVNSIQCDAIVKDLFEQFGVKTSYVTDGVTLTKGKRSVQFFEYDFANNPDLVPTFAVLCVMLNVPFRMKGVKDLHFKGNDRIKSLQSELSKLGAVITLEVQDEQEILCFNGKAMRAPNQAIDISTFDDHRMVMAFAPIAAMGIPVIVENPKLTSKSYPSFWDDFKKTGFLVDQLQQTNAGSKKGTVVLKE